MKLVIHEPESTALTRAISADAYLATSVVAAVEVSRAVKIASAEDDAEADAEDLLDGCLLVDLDPPIRRSAATLASRHLRPLDAIHLATALSVGPEAMFVYDRALARAASRLGLRVESPGAKP